MRGRIYKVKNFRTIQSVCCSKIFKYLSAKTPAGGSMGIMDKLLGRSEKLSIEDFEEIDLSDYEAEISEEAEMVVKVAEITGLNEVPEIKRQIYDGNIVIADIAFIKHDKLTLDRVLKDLRQLAEDVKGDIVGLGEDYVIITPTGTKVDRNKIRGVR